MPARRVIVYPQGGGAPTPATYNAGADVTRLRRQAKVFANSEIQVQNSSRLILPFGTSGGSSGVQVGPNAKFVLSSDGVTPTFIISYHLNSMQFGPTTFGTSLWPGCANVSALGWSQFTQRWANTLPAGRARQKGTINNLRVGIGSACYMAYTGISWDGGTGSSGNYRALGVNDDNGRPLYCASLTGGGKGTTPGTEVAGDPTAYRNYIDTIVQNWLGAQIFDGIFRTVTLTIEFSSPVWTATGQVLLPVDQPATLCTADIPCLQALAAKYGSNKQVLIEPYNELFGTTITTNTEDAWLSQANSSGAFNSNPQPFAFPTATTSPSGTGGGYRMGIGGTFALGGGQTCQAVSWQQALKAYRAAGGRNVVAIGCTVASSRLASWNYCGGSQLVVDPYMVNGIQQIAAAFHAYNQYETTAHADQIAANIPFYCTEAGSITAVGGNANAVPGMSYERYLNNYSGYTWSSCNNFINPPLASIDTTGPVLGNPSTLQSTAPWYQVNVPHLASGANNDGSDTTQIPTASN